MKNTISSLLITLGAISTASADLEILQATTSGYTPAVTVTSTEVVEFYGSAHTGNSSAVLKLTVNSLSYSFGLYTSDIKGLTFPGPLTFSLFSSTSAYGGLVSYRIVDSTVYAKNETPSNIKEKFMASVNRAIVKPPALITPNEKTRSIFEVPNS